MKPSILKKMSGDDDDYKDDDGGWGVYFSSHLKTTNNFEEGLCIHKLLKRRNRNPLHKRVLWVCVYLIS